MLKLIAGVIRTRSLLVIWNGKLESGRVTLLTVNTKVSTVASATMSFIRKNDVLRERQQNVFGYV